MNEFFIKTGDNNTAQRLISKGYKMLGFDTATGIYTFLNDVSITFTKDKNDKLVFTNSLEM